MRMVMVRLQLLLLLVRIRRMNVMGVMVGALHTGRAGQGPRNRSYSGGSGRLCVVGGSATVSLQEWLRLKTAGCRVDLVGV